jgi:hypothetical protein
MAEPENFEDDLFADLYVYSALMGASEEDTLQHHAVLFAFNQ